LTDLKKRGVEGPEKFLEDSQINFVITEDYPAALATAFEMLGSKPTLIFSHPTMIATSGYGFFAYDQILHRGNNVWSFAFSAKEINAAYKLWAQNQPALASQTKTAAYLNVKDMSEKLFRPDHF